MNARKPSLDIPTDGLDADEARRVARFQALIQEGLDDLAAGRFEVVEDIGAWMDSLGPADERGEDD